MLAQRGKGDGGTPTAVITILLALSAALLAALPGDFNIAFADDGGFRECGNPGLWQWITACDGSGSVVGQAPGAATSSAPGATDAPRRRWRSW